MLEKISVVVPCKNEERYISLCIDSLLAQKKDGYDLEIIVVDNGSTDHTPETLRDFSSSVTSYFMPDISIPDVRNYGAKRATGEWIAFVDADVEVDEHWCRQIEYTIGRLRNKGIDVNTIIIGSTCTIPDNPTWVEEIWFQQLRQRDIQSARYINGANMIMHRSLFHSVGGFNSHYTTGEDEKFCEDARVKGANIFKDNSIKAIHHGYPKTAMQFFRRERWHGQGMSQYFFTPWRSKDLLLAIYFLGVMLIMSIFLIIYGGIVRGVLLIFLIMMAPLLPFSYVRSEKNIKKTIFISCLYFLYGWARVFSLVDIIKPSAANTLRFKDVVK